MYISLHSKPTELGAGPQRSETQHSGTVHRDLCDMLRDSVIVGLDNRVPLASIAAVVSICEYTVSNKGGLPCHCLGDCGGTAISATCRETRE